MEKKRNEPSLNRMYDDFADLWTLISNLEDYTEEADYWRKVLREKLGSGRHEILEIGVGGGHNLYHLTGDFDATASDISEKMLAQCHELIPDIPLHVGDMRTVRLGRKFKAVLIHDAIDYMLTEEDLKQTFATAVAHLKPGGIFVTAPENFRETFCSPSVDHFTNSNDETELTVIMYAYDPDPNDTVTETLFYYHIRTKQGLRVEQDRHLHGLFPLKVWLKLMQEAGFTVEKYPYPVHDDGREAYLLVGTLI
ncbi:MAG: methyltransferase domain-containing protein [Candidatus Hatepunaea meridiana]|nr:methyltransferase domain-containing protein [Candidatus Hatepunaea meridiana]